MRLPGFAVAVPDLGDMLSRVRHAFSRLYGALLVSTSVCVSGNRPECAVAFPLCVFFFF